MPEKKRRFRKFLAWTLLLIVTTITGGVWFAYTSTTDSKAIAQLIRQHGPEFLPKCLFDLGRAQLSLISGHVTFSHINVRQPLDGSTFMTLSLPWLKLNYDARAAVDGRFIPREVDVAQPTLRLRQRKDGTWNVQGFVADPFPDYGVISTPAINIKNGTVEMIREVEDKDVPTLLLRQVNITIAPSASKDDKITFEGSAKGDLFDRIDVKGSLDRRTGKFQFAGDLARLLVSQTLRDRLPPDFEEQLRPVGLTGGIVDVKFQDILFDSMTNTFERKEATAWLQSGVLQCPNLPFPINNLAAVAKLKNDLITIESVEGDNGRSHIRASGVMALGDPKSTPFDLKLEAQRIELDDRIKRWTPKEFENLWNEYLPSGLLNVTARAFRAKPGANVEITSVIDFIDLAMTYHLFKYPVEHVRGQLIIEDKLITLSDCHALLGGKPAKCHGTVVNPGADAIVNLEFQAEGLPIDKPLLEAMPPDVRQVVSEFHPTGSVKGKLTVRRDPRRLPTDPEEGIVRIDAELDLHERCSMRWDKLPYPIENMSGHLVIHPDQWIFTNMQGYNGTVLVAGNGEVLKMGTDAQGRDRLKVALNLVANNLPFDEQLRKSLPEAWQKSWKTLNPTGSCSMTAKILVEPDKPDDYHLEIQPKADSGIHLMFDRPAKPGIDPGGFIDMRMEGATGYFQFKNGVVTMKDVGFDFRGARVQFDSGRVVVEDSGRFDLAVYRLSTNNFRLDAKLREMMPPVMAQFARRVGDDRPFTFHTDLALSWPGPGTNVTCAWKDALIVLDGNTIQAGSTPISLQGQLQDLRGKFDGQSLEIDGLVNLNSVATMGQQITRFESPLQVKDGIARLADLRGTFLDGELRGSVEISLDNTPRYAARIEAQGVDLESYARTLPGKQSYRGKVAGKVEFNGLGPDLRTLQGEGEMRVNNANLGELNFVLQLLKSIKVLKPSDKTAFDTAYVKLKVQNGLSSFDPVSLGGDPFSLVGSGTMGLQGDLNLRFDLIYGRDRFHIPILSDAVREIGSQFYEIRVRGTPASPRPDIQPLPQVGNTLKAMTKGKDDNKSPKRR